MTFTSRLSPSIFHTVSDKNLTRGKAGYEATPLGVDHSLSNPTCPLGVDPPPPPPLSQTLPAPLAWTTLSNPTCPSWRGPPLSLSNLTCPLGVDHSLKPYLPPRRGPLSQTLPAPSAWTTLSQTLPAPLAWTTLSGILSRSK